jgi:hypothetical protein
MSLYGKKIPNCREKGYKKISKNVLTRTAKVAMIATK